MLQQLLALVIIVFLLVRLIRQRQRKQIAAGEFYFWLAFWLLAGLAIAGIKLIDQLVARLGFSSSGIQILLYVAIAALFYLIFRTRLRLEKLERDITKIVSHIALDSGASKNGAAEQNPNLKPKI